MSEPARLAGVYFDPGRTFTDIAARPRWWPPIVLMIIAGVAMMYSYSQHVGWERMARQQIESNSRTANLPVEQREQAIARSAQFTPYFVYGAAVLGSPVSILITAVILMAAMNTLFGAGVVFRKAFAVTAYAMLPGLLMAILAIVVMFLKSPEDFDLQNPLAFNLGAFVSAESAKWLKSLLSSFDLFTFWNMALLATGFAAAATKRLTWSKALTGVVACWVIWVLLKVGSTAIFS
jgi:hypothetical protein